VDTSTPLRKKNETLIVYGESQRRNFRPLEDKKYYSLFSRFIVGCFKSRIIKTWKQIRSKFTQPKNCKNLSQDLYAFSVNRSVLIFAKKLGFFNFYFDISKKIIVLSF
jgi:hypothetical protein